MQDHDKGQPLPLVNQPPAPASPRTPARPAPPEPGGELLFVVEERPDGSLVARAPAIDLVVAARDQAELRERIQDAVDDRFPEGTAPARIRLHRRARHG
ncbi:MAG: hypothetical protein U0531_19515 [Dehalococcoidia bacterium]